MLVISFDHLPKCTSMYFEALVSLTTNIVFAFAKLYVKKGINLFHHVCDKKGKRKETTKQKEEKQQQNKKSDKVMTMNILVSFNWVWRHYQLNHLKNIKIYK